MTVILEISKGDIVFEPAELLLEFLFSVFGRIFGRSIPTAPVSEWDWPQWLWLCVALFVAGLVARVIYRKFTGPAGNAKT